MSAIRTLLLVRCFSGLSPNGGCPPAGTVAGRHSFLLFLLAVLLLARERPGATFLLIPPVARATGMAYAFTAIADDASANYYNAAGLAFLESPTVCLSHFKYVPWLISDMPYLYCAAALPLAKCTWGADMIYFEEGETQVTNEEGQYINSYALWRLGLKLNYARIVLPNLACAIGLKYVQVSRMEYYWIFFEEVPLSWDYWVPGVPERCTGISWAFDLNGLYRVMPYFTVGAVLHNLGPRLHYTSGGLGRPLPLTSRLSLACRPLENRFYRVRLCAELTKGLVGAFGDEEKSFFDELDYELAEAWKGVGIEVTVFKMLSLRGGHFWDVEGARRGFTYGAGVKFKGLALDIGIDEDIFDFETTNRLLTLSYRF